MLNTETVAVRCRQFQVRIGCIDCTQRRLRLRLTRCDYTFRNTAKCAARQHVQVAGNTGIGDI